MKVHKFTIATIALIASISAESALAQNRALLLFDDEDDRFAGCLNCNRYDDASICNRYGKYGSRYEEYSIWNRYGTYGSKYNRMSPWNKYGQGLAIVDSDGNFYGRFTRSYNNPSRLELPKALIAAYEEDDDLQELRDALCE